LRRQRDAGEVPDAVRSDAVRIDRIALLEKIQSAAAALQAAESVRFAQSQAKEQQAANVHPDKIGRGIADQLGLACKISWFAAARRLGVARALWFELPECYRSLAAGEISEYVASLVVTETRHLDAHQTRCGRQDRRCWDCADGGRGAPRRALASMPTRPIVELMCSGAGPSGKTVGSACGRRRTP
jgi:hypothetical protein